MKNNYLKIYLNFLDLEIPNIIQIVGGLSLVNFLLHNIYYSIPIILVITYLIDRYLLAQFHEFTKNQFSNSNVKLNQENIDIEEFRLRFRKFLRLTSVVFCVISTLFALGVTVFHS